MNETPFIVIPVYNRCETTLCCLRVLSSQGVLEWAQILIVDDGSTDGTKATVQREFPMVTVLDGGGDLWWGRAINLGMEHAFGEGASHIFWLNDDCHPRPLALQNLLDESRKSGAITTAQCVLRETGILHYGGMSREASGLKMINCGQEETRECDTICGNCVCIPRSVIEKIGFVDAAVFPHFAGDADFGLRAKQVGYRLLVLGNALCDSTYGSAKNRQSWLLGDMSLKQLWALCFHPMNGTLARPGFMFQMRHWGVSGLRQYLLAFLKLVAVSILRITIPHSLRLSLFGKNHATHQHIAAVKKWEAAHRA